MCASRLLTFPRALLWQIPVSVVAGSYAWVTTFQDGNMRPWMKSSTHLDEALQQFAGKQERMGYLIHRCRKAGALFFPHCFFSELEL